LISTPARVEFLEIFRRTTVNQAHEVERIGISNPGRERRIARTFEPVMVSFAHDMDCCEIGMLDIDEKILDLTAAAGNK
jgi:hypothetical protein